MADGFDQMTTFVAVAGLRLGRGAGSQMPLDSIALAAGGNLTARPYDRPPIDASGGRGAFGFGLARWPLAVCV